LFKLLIANLAKLRCNGNIINAEQCRENLNKARYAKEIGLLKLRPQKANPLA